MKKEKKEKIVKYSLIILTIIILLTLIAEVFLFNIWKTVCGSSCVSIPVSELIVNTRHAMSGIYTETDTICLSAGEFITIDSITNEFSNMDQLTFICDSNLCKGDNPSMRLTENHLEALSDVVFKSYITCDKSTDDTYLCDAYIRDDNISCGGKTTSLVPLLIIEIILFLVLFLVFHNLRKH